MLNWRSFWADLRLPTSPGEVAQHRAAEYWWLCATSYERRQRRHSTSRMNMQCLCGTVVLAVKMLCPDKIQKVATLSAGGRRTTIQARQGVHHPHLTDQVLLESLEESAIQVGLLVQKLQGHPLTAGGTLCSRPDGVLKPRNPNHGFKGHHSVPWTPWRPNGPRFFLYQYWVIYFGQKNNLTMNLTNIVVDVQNSNNNIFLKTILQGRFWIYFLDIQFLRENQKIL